MKVFLFLALICFSLAIVYGETEEQKVEEEVEEELDCETEFPGSHSDGKGNCVEVVEEKCTRTTNGGEIEEFPCEEYKYEYEKKK